MKSRFLGKTIHVILVAIAAGACSSQGIDISSDWGTTTSELASWANGNFSHVLRVNAGEVMVRNICELTVPVAAPKPLTFIATGNTGIGTSGGSLAWTGSAASGSGISVNGCSSYPCEVVARWQGTSISGSALGCQIAADDGTSRLVGNSAGTVLSLASAPPAAVIFNQDVKIGSVGAAIAASCVLRESAQLPNAEVAAFGVWLNGSNVVSLPGPIAVGSSIWPSDGPSVPFGTIYVGSEPGATRLKHVAARKEQLMEGDVLRCAGTFSSSSGVPVFDINVSVPGSVGTSLARGATGWTCSSSSFGTGDGCNCGCGIVDPDCSPGDAECSPWINEFHYDNSGTDANEGVEIAGPAGKNLSGYSLELYNGATFTSYGNVALSGIIPNQMNGFGTLWFPLPVNGLQNGSPDGIALVNQTANVVEFLCYEGTMIAAGGPAAGMTCLDIGVSEIGFDVPGMSLQLNGQGHSSADFTWTFPAPASPGAVNANQTLQ